MKYKVGDIIKWSNYNERFLIKDIKPSSEPNTKKYTLVELKTGTTYKDYEYDNDFYEEVSLCQESMWYKEIKEIIDE